MDHFKKEKERLAQFDNNIHSQKKVSLKKKSLKQDERLSPFSLKVQELINKNASHPLILKMKTPNHYKKLDTDEKVQFLLLLFSILWGKFPNRRKDINNYIENYLGNCNIPRDRLGVSELLIFPGIVCPCREQLKLLGIHMQYKRTVSRIYEVTDNSHIATSILLNGGSEDEHDMGMKFILSLHLTDTQSDTITDGDIRSLLYSLKIENPVRVIRGFKCKSRFSPSTGYRYDGLYKIIEFMIEKDSTKNHVFKFIFSIIEPKSYRMISEATIPKFEEFFAKYHKPLSNHLKRQISEKQYLIKHPSFLPPTRLFNVYYESKFLFRINLPYMVHLPPSGTPVLVNFLILMKTLTRAYKIYCRKANCYPYWLEILWQYELADSDLTKPAWAKAGFLPFVLVVNFRRTLIPRDKGSDVSTTDSSLQSVLSEQMKLPINYKMATRPAIPHFPQSSEQAIFSHIELAAPMNNSWNPYFDLSNGQENFPIPVINEIDQNRPPLDFTYIKTSIYFSRIHASSLAKCCPGCTPLLSKENNKENRSLDSYETKFDGLSKPTYCPGFQQEYIKNYNCEFTCGDYCPCDPLKCSNRYKSGLQFACQVIKTSTKNWELRTIDFIPKDSFIINYSGELITRAMMESRELITEKLGYCNYFLESVEFENRNDDWMMPCVDSSFFGNAARFMNHSCMPNVTIKTVWSFSDFPSLCVIALRDIKPFESLTYYYGHCYENIKCFCGTPQCEGYIGKGTKK